MKLGLNQLLIACVASFFAGCLSPLPSDGASVLAPASTPFSSVSTHDSVAFTARPSADRRRAAITEPRPSEIEEARVLILQAHTVYLQGDYDGAEVKLKRAVTLYPFVADGYLLLGKIFLIRGSATRDYSLLNNARLMFEMARAMDPSLIETEQLLTLFTVRFSH